MTQATNSEEVILYDSPEAAQFVTDVSGWRSRTGGFYESEEGLARFFGCTHRRCQGEGCQEIIGKNYTLCAACRKKDDLEKYQQRPQLVWHSRDYPVYSEAADTFFMTAEELVNFIKRFPDYCSLADLHLVNCEPVYTQERSFAFIFDVAHSEYKETEAPPELLEILAKINKLIRSYKAPLFFLPGAFRLVPTPNVVNYFAALFDPYLRGNSSETV